MKKQVIQNSTFYPHIMNYNGIKELHSESLRLTKFVSSQEETIYVLENQISKFLEEIEKIKNHQCLSLNVLHVVSAYKKSACKDLARKLMIQKRPC